MTEVIVVVVIPVGAVRKIRKGYLLVIRAQGIKQTQLLVRSQIHPRAIRCFFPKQYLLFPCNLSHIRKRRVKMPCRNLSQEGRRQRPCNIIGCSECTVGAIQAGNSLCFCLERIHLLSPSVAYVDLRILLSGLVSSLRIKDMIVISFAQKSFNLPDFLRSPSFTPPASPPPRSAPRWHGARGARSSGR